MHSDRQFHFGVHDAHSYMIGIGIEDFTEQ